MQNYKPTYLPDGSELLDTVEQSEMIVYEFAINNSGGFEILLSKSDTKVYLNTENTEITPFDQNEIAGYYFKKGDLNYVCCDRDGYLVLQENNSKNLSLFSSLCVIWVVPQ